VFFAVFCASTSLVVVDLLPRVLNFNIASANGACPSVYLVFCLAPVPHQLRGEWLQRVACLPVADLVEPAALRALLEQAEQLSAYLQTVLVNDRHMLLRLEQHCAWAPAVAASSSAKSTAASSAAHAGSLAAGASARAEIASTLHESALFVEPEHQGEFADGCVRMAAFLGAQWRRVQMHLEVICLFLI
jgi:hypothetical protein